MRSLNITRFALAFATTIALYACGEDCSSDAPYDIPKEAGTIYRYMDVQSIDAEKISIDYGSCEPDTLGNLYWGTYFRTILYSIHNDTLLYTKIDDDGDSSKHTEIYIGNNSSIIGNWIETGCEYMRDNEGTTLDCDASIFTTTLNISNEKAIAIGKLNSNLDIMSNNEICYDLYDISYELEDLCIDKYDSIKDVHGKQFVPDVIMLNDSISLIRKSPLSYVVKIGSAEILFSKSFDVTEDSWTKHSSISFGEKTCIDKYTTTFIPKEKCNESNKAFYTDLIRSEQQIEDKFIQCYEDMLSHIQSLLTQEENTLYKKAVTKRTFSKKRTLFEQ